MSDLLPCPFCGDAPFVMRSGVVICECGACRLDAERWNRRVSYLLPEDKETLRFCGVIADIEGQPEADEVRALIARLEGKP